MLMRPSTNVRSCSNQICGNSPRRLSARLQRGSHLILYGPRGSGKSTLLGAMRDDYRATANSLCNLGQNLRVAGHCRSSIAGVSRG